MYMNLITW